MVFCICLLSNNIKKGLHGGIGRHNGLKIHYLINRCAGSTPVVGTSVS